MTPQTRLKVYEEMLKMFEEDVEYEIMFGFCGSLSFVDVNELQDEDRDIENFPELMKRKPDDDNVFWWSIYSQSGRLKRIEVLKQAIEEVKQIINDTIHIT